MIQVGLLDISLDGSQTGTVWLTWPGLMSAKAAADFLSEHPTVKIVVVVDTHCLKNGKLIWQGGKSTSYEACNMDEVCVTCPYTITPLSHRFKDNQGLHPQAGSEVHVHCGRL